MHFSGGPFPLAIVSVSFFLLPLLLLPLLRVGATAGNTVNLLDCTLHSKTGVPIHGLRNVTLGGTGVEFCSFYGVPYARPPVKKYRFQKAQQIRLINSKTRQLTFKTPPPECTQESQEKGTLVGQENCLFLNIFTRNPRRRVSVDGRSNVPRGSLQPVVVWIHGGTFSLGSGLSDGFNPSAFLEEDIVVVSFNYRLDLFGFFPITLEEPYSMNLGLDDQKVALRWVKKHIRLFGGDPNRVTILGWSAGSASVNYLMYDKEAKGLFQSAIAMSGSFLSPWAFSNFPMQMRKNLCDSFKVHNCTLSGMIREMGKNFTDMALLVKLFTRGMTKVIWGTSFPFFSPYPEYPGDSPELRMREGPLNDVPLMIGVTDNETKDFQLGYHMELKTNFVFANNDPNVVDQVLEMLWNLENESEASLKEHLSMADLYHGVYKFMELHGRRSRKNVYAYRFGFSPESCEGAAHGDDIRLLFRTYNYTASGVEVGERRQIVGRKMEKLWTNFIKFRTPIVGDSDVQWPVYTTSDEDLTGDTSGRQVFQIEEPIFNAITEQQLPLFRIWDDIFHCLNNFVCDKPIWNGTEGLLGVGESDEVSERCPPKEYDYEENLDV